MEQERGVHVTGSHRGAENLEIFIIYSLITEAGLLDILGHPERSSPEKYQDDRECETR